jgi:hypothetical protein
MPYGPRNSFSSSKVKVVLLDVLAVVALAVGESEQPPLLQDRVALVPQSKSKAQPLLFIAESCGPFLTPPVCPRARLVMGDGALELQRYWRLRIKVGQSRQDVVDQEI